MEIPTNITTARIMGKPKKKYYSEGTLVCDTIQEHINEVKTLGTYPAEVEHFDEEFKKLVKLIESTPKTP